MDMPAGSVKCITTLAHTEQVRVAEFEMAGNTSGDIHYHSLATEHCLCLQGLFQVEIAGRRVASLRPGERFEVPAGVSHRIVNAGQAPCRYLVIQSGGAYDFVVQ